MNKILFLIRGAPGSGKTELAYALVGMARVHVMWEADMYWWEKYGEYKWNPEEIREAHTWCQRKVEESMKVGHAIAVSNTLTTQKELKPYYQLADRYGYKVQEIIMRFPVFENRHNVPTKKVLEYQKRLEDSLR